MGEAAKATVKNQLDLLYKRDKMERRVIVDGDNPVYAYPSKSGEIRKMFELEALRADVIATAEKRRVAEQAVDDHKQQMMQSYLYAGGTQSDFEQLWPSIRQKFVLERMGLGGKE